MDRADRPRHALGRARAHAEVAAPVRRGSRRAGAVAWVEGFSSDRGTLTGTVHVLGRGPVAPELHATLDRVRRRGQRSGWPAGAERERSRAACRSTAPTKRSPAGRSRSARASRRRSRRAPTARAQPPRTRARTIRPRSCSGRTAAARTLTALNAEVAPRLGSVDAQRTAGSPSTASRSRGCSRSRASGRRAHCRSSWSFTAARPGAGPGYSRPGSGSYSPPTATRRFLPNVRGSVGRGPEFAEANLGDMGGGDLQDILTGVDALVSDGIVDDARVAITGGSYGGFMSSWAITQTDRFAAAMPFAVVTDWVSFHSTTNIGQFDRLYLQADPWDAAGEYTNRSPVYHAHKCKHADADPPRRGRPLHPARPGVRALQRARRGAAARRSSSSIRARATGGRSASTSSTPGTACATGSRGTSRR